MMAQLQPIDRLLEDPSVSDAHKAKLRLVREAIEYGEREMGLDPASSFRSYFDTQGRPVTYIVSACARDRFAPHTWWFPIVGTVPYKGFFSKEDAEQEAESLRARGLDVHLGTAAAYSTLGWFPDPDLSTMLDLPDEDLVNLVLHEITHTTLWLPGGVDFNEGLASFVGGHGALEFARKKHGVGSTAYERTVRMLAWEELRDARSRELRRRLDELYASALSSEEKVRRRDEIYAAFVAEERVKIDGLFPRASTAAPPAALPCGAVDLLHRPSSRTDDLEIYATLAAGLPRGAPRVNNAIVLMQRRYGRGDEFRAVFDHLGGDWRRFLERMKLMAGKSS